MRRRLSLAPVSLVAVCGLVALGTISKAAEPLPSVDRWIPEEAVLSVQINEPKPILDMVLDPKVIEQVTALPAYQEAMKNPETAQVKNLVNFLEVKLGTDWKTAVHKLLDGGITFAVAPSDGFLLAVDATDARMLKTTHDVFRDIAKGEAEKAGEPERVESKEYKGVTGWTFGGDEVHGILGERFMLTNKSKAMQAALDLRADGGASLAKKPGYVAARRAVGTNSVGTAYLDLATFKQVPGFQKAMSEAENPLVVLLFSGMQETIRSSAWLGVGLDVRKDALALRAATDGKVGGSNFSRPAANKGALPNLVVPRRMAGMSLYRDLHQFYSAKDDLFPERTNGIIFFENMMGIFFTGRDLTDEVLAKVEPEIRVVVAEQAYDPAIGTPAMQLPAFAVVFEMNDPKKFGVVVEEAWQKALGLINFTRGQKAEPGLMIRTPPQDDPKTFMTVSYFSHEEEKDKKSLDVRFNFRPTLARHGKHLILSSTDQLAKDVIAALKLEDAQATRPLVGVHSMIDADAVRIASVLAANREALIRQNMVEDGNSRSEAEAHVAIILEVVKHLGQTRLIIGERGGQASARLDLWPNIPTSR